MIQFVDPIEFVVIAVAHSFQHSFEKSITIFIVGCFEEVKTTGIAQILGKFFCKIFVN